MFDLEVFIRLVVFAVLVGIGIIVWPKLKNLRAQRPVNGQWTGEGNGGVPPREENLDMASNDRMAAGYPTAVAAKMMPGDHL